MESMNWLYTLYTFVQKFGVSFFIINNFIKCIELIRIDYKTFTL